MKSPHRSPTSSCSFSLRRSGVTAHPVHHTDVKGLAPRAAPTRESRQLANERQRGLPAEARTERAVPRVNLPCNLGPALFIFSVTWGYFSYYSSWGEIDSRTGLRSFVSRLASAASPALLGTTACTTVTTLALHQPPEVLFLPASLLSERCVGLLLASGHLIPLLSSPLRLPLLALES